MLGRVRRYDDQSLQQWPTIVSCRLNVLCHRSPFLLQTFFGYSLFSSIIVSPEISRLLHTSEWNKTNRMLSRYLQCCYPQKEVKIEERDLFCFVVSTCTSDIGVMYRIECFQLWTNAYTCMYIDSTCPYQRIKYTSILKSCWMLSLFQSHLPTTVRSSIGRFFSYSFVSCGVLHRYSRLCL